MHGFYILAGYFFSYSYEKHGLRKAIEARLVRLGVPLIFIGMTLNILMNAMSDQRDYEDHFSTYLLHGEWLGHLWFIGNLLVYTLLGGALAVLFRNAILPRWNKYLQAATLFFGAPFLCLCFLFVAKFLPDENILFISTYNFFLYFAFYILGMAFYRMHDAFFTLLEPRFCTVLAAVACTITLTLSPSGVLYNYALNLQGLALSLFVIGTCCAFPARGLFMKEAAAASYSIYLLHQPLLIFFFPALLFLGFNHWQSFLLLFLMTLSASFLIDRKAVTKSPILGFLINGTTSGFRKKLA